MANSHFITLAFLITLSFSSINGALGARRLLQNPAPDPFVPNIPGLNFPPLPDTGYPEVRLPPLPTNDIPAVPIDPTTFPSIPFFSPTTNP
ncbi:hypothetical protein Patl1_32724 [Pistacia atlantica]|uniref:Uncharacterized protein n=1 Tax=Pistacia atlantica TaxID=434234 RepID=A0ACC1AN81_9ROSI|nr:hypothetical protein Patl1_32724 [Pistacia atlantica]